MGVAVAVQGCLPGFCPSPVGCVICRAALRGPAVPVQGPFANSTAAGCPPGFCPSPVGCRICRAALRGAAVAVQGPLANSTAASATGCLPGCESHWYGCRCHDGIAFQQTAPVASSSVADAMLV